MLKFKKLVNLIKEDLSGSPIDLKLNSEELFLILDVFRDLDDEAIVRVDPKDKPLMSNLLKKLEDLYKQHGGTEESEDLNPTDMTRKPASIAQHALSKWAKSGRGVGEDEIDDEKDKDI